MLTQRELVPEGSATAKARDYSLKRWVALTRYLEDGAVPIDKNQVEDLIRTWALGRSNWLFAGSLRSGKRAAAFMSLIQSARMNGHDPYAYLKDVSRESGAIHARLAVSAAVAFINFVSETHRYREASESQR